MILLVNIFLLKFWFTDEWDNFSKHKTILRKRKFTFQSLDIGNFSLIPFYASFSTFRKLIFFRIKVGELSKLVAIDMDEFFSRNAVIFISTFGHFVICNATISRLVFQSTAKTLQLSVYPSFSWELANFRLWAAFSCQTARFFWIRFQILVSEVLFCDLPSFILICQPSSLFSSLFFGTQIQNMINSKSLFILSQIQQYFFS